MHVVRRHLVDALLVPRLTAERLREKRPDQPDRLSHAVHPSTDRDHLGVVVPPGQPGRLLAPRQPAPDTGHLVGRDLLAVPGAADDDSEALRIVADRLGHPQAVGRVVVGRVVDVRAVVDRFVAV